MHGVEQTINNNICLIDQRNVRLWRDDRGGSQYAERHYESAAAEHPGRKPREKPSK